MHSYTCTPIWGQYGPVNGLFCRSVDTEAYNSSTDGQNRVFMSVCVGTCRQTMVSSPLFVYTALHVVACMHEPTYDGLYIGVRINRDRLVDTGGHTAVLIVDVMGNSVPYRYWIEGI